MILDISQLHKDQISKDYKTRKARKVEIFATRLAGLLPICGLIEGYADITRWSRTGTIDPMGKLRNEDDLCKIIEDVVLIYKQYSGENQYRLVYRSESESHTAWQWRDAKLIGRMNVQICEGDAIEGQATESDSPSEKA